MTRLLRPTSDSPPGRAGIPPTRQGSPWSPTSARPYRFHRVPTGDGRQLSSSVHRTRAAQAESTRQRSCRPLPTPRIYTPGDRPKGRSLTPAAAPFPYLSRKDLEMGLALCIFVVWVVTRCGFPRGKPALRPLPGPSGHLAFHSLRSRKGGTDAAQRRSVPAEKKTGSPLRARTFFRRLPPGQRHEKR